MAAAIIEPIDELFARRILSMKTIIIGNLLTLLPLVLMLLGMGAVAAGTCYAFGEDLGFVDENTIDPITGGLLIGVGFVVAGSSAYWGLRNVTKLGNWYLRRVARSEIKSRPDGLVDPDDPEAIFVEIVPRENWQKLMLETATDIGFLLVDEGRREVLFEGDRERMRIPAAAIQSCKVAQTMIGGGTPGEMEYYFTVIRAEDGDGTRELPFAYRGDLGQYGAGVREERAKDLRDRIRELSP